MNEPHLITAFPQKPLSIDRASGSYLWAQDGRRYIDLGGASHGVANFGHNHPRIVAAVQEQLSQVTHVSTTIPTPARRLFLERLHELLPSHLDRTFLSNSGTEAVEAALKFAHAATGRTKVVALRNAFHGRTLGALSATFRPAYRQPFERLLQAVDFVPLNDAEALASTVTQETAAILVEPVQGEGGLGVASPEFLQAAERVARSHGALLVVDEVQTGLGRAGHDLAIQASGVRPDILLLGKSLAGGLPIGATCMTQEVAQAMPAAGHGNTFGGSPLVCAAAAAALDVLREERLAERAQTEGDRFRAALSRIPSNLIRDVRGAGLMVGLDLRVKPAPLLASLLERGFLALPSGLTVARFLPPLTTAREDLDAAAEAVRLGLETLQLEPEARAA